MQAFPLFSVFQIPDCRNAENVLVFVLSGFRDSGNHDARVPPFPFLTPGCRNVEMSQHLSFRVFAFRKIWVQRISLLIGIPGCRNTEMPRCQNALAFDQQLTIVPEIYDPRSISLFLYFAIRGFGRQGPLSYPCSLEFSIVEIPKCRNDEMP
jgi:hypothetical protein